MAEAKSSIQCNIKSESNSNYQLQNASLILVKLKKNQTLASWH